MRRYMFHCKKCGHNIECATKGDWLLEKQTHKREGCKLDFAPHRDDFILTRPQLAEEAKRGKEMVMEQIGSLEAVDEDTHTSDEPIPGLAESQVESD